jgi:hypothetical protein
MSNPLIAGAETTQQANITRAAQHATSSMSIGEQLKEAAEPTEHIRDTLPPIDPPEPATPLNPYAPTGWRKKQRVEFDVTLPSGQLSRVLRLEREDLFRLNLMSYLDTFTPLLMEDSISGEERNKRMRETLTKQPDSIANMFMAIDEVVMAATLRPRVTNDEKKVDYGGPDDWTNPQFIATAYIEDIGMEDRMAIFASAFGRSMDDLKSVWEQAGSVAGMANGSSVQPAAEPDL